MAQQQSPETAQPTIEDLILERIYPLKANARFISEAHKLRSRELQTQWRLMHIALVLCIFVEIIVLTLMPVGSRLFTAYAAYAALALLLLIVLGIAIILRKNDLENREVHSDAAADQWRKLYEDMTTFEFRLKIKDDSTRVIASIKDFEIRFANLKRITPEVDRNSFARVIATQSRAWYTQQEKMYKSYSWSKLEAHSRLCEAVIDSC